MNHTLPQPLWETIDQRRNKSALAAELTPLSLDTAIGRASFAGSSDIYWSDLDTCTCMDFHINNARSAPCKHMIRLAMELQLLPSIGKQTDIEAAQYKVALYQVGQTIKGGELLDAVKVAAFLKEVYAKGKSDIVDSEGIDSSPLRFFFELSKDRRTAKPIKSRKKDALTLVKSAEARLGDWLLSTPSALMAAFEGYVEEN